MIEQEVLTYMLVNRDDSLIHLTSEYFLVYSKEFNYLKDYYSQHLSLPTMQMFLDEFPEFQVESTGRARDLLLDSLYSYLNQHKNIESVAKEIYEEPIPIVHYFSGPWTEENYYEEIEDTNEPYYSSGGDPYEPGGILKSDES